jgi:dihydrofolate reductase
MPITVLNHVTLDGRMQAPGRPDEDTRGGFTQGGWAEAGNDEVLGRFLGERMGAGEKRALLFGRRTYEDLLSFWNTQPDSPFTPMLNESPKYVASKTLVEPLPWPNSTLLGVDAASAVAVLKKKEPDTSFMIMGSQALIKSLQPLDLIDEWLLLIHPMVLGNGLQLFEESTPMPLSLVESIPTTTGVIIATYRPSRESD